MIHDNVETLCVRLKEQLADGGVAEMRKNFLAMATDTLCGHAFDKSLNLLQSDQAAINWQKTIKAIATLTPLIKQFTWIIPCALMLPLGPLRIIVPDLARIVALHRVRLSQLFLYDALLYLGGKSVTPGLCSTCISKRNKQSMTVQTSTKLTRPKRRL